jgi:catechol 2,3-dioxygenase-like lactoylglutathione lyase family enzyme
MTGLGGPRFVLHHSAVVVSDLDRSIDFYRAMFDVEPEVRLSDVIDDAGGHGVPEARYSLAFLPFASGRVELVQYELPSDGSRRPPRSWDVGSSHIGFVVPDDFDATIAELTSRGMRFVGEPTHAKDGPMAGLARAFGQDPDGNRIEFIQLPRESRATH